MRTVDELLTIGTEFGAGVARTATALRSMVDGITGLVKVPVWTIGEKATRCERSVRYHLRRLERAGIIERDEDQPPDCAQRANWYRWIGVAPEKQRAQVEARRKRREVQREIRKAYNAGKREKRQESLKAIISRSIKHGVELSLKAYWLQHAAAMECMAQSDSIYSDRFSPSQSLLRLMKEKGWRS